MRLLVLTVLTLELSFYQVAAEGENWSINSGEPPSTTAEEFAKRHHEDAIEEQQSWLFLRATKAQWGGGRYSKQEKKKILEAHNKYRKGVSPSSSDMNELVWSTTLAEQAQTWSDGCYYEHPDDENRYPDYEGIGQNLYINYLDKGGKNPPSPVTDPVDKWYDEVRYYHYNANACNAGKVCGHYIQVVWATTTKVGCGITFCPVARSKTKSYKNAWLVTCNYSPGRVKGPFPYKSGEQCSQCEKGFCKDNLCSKCKPPEKGCECNMECQHGGRMNAKKCTCQCADGFNGLACEERCEDKDDRCGPYGDWPAILCTHEIHGPIITQKCPALCGECTPGP